ncbi:MAG: hypothetical protein GC154_03205 [bacterium]|nr:hypothetical protein [bacterium]
MNDEPLRDEFLTLYFDPDSPEADRTRERIEQDAALREEYEAFAAAMNLARRFEAPAQSPSARVETFEAAWKASGRGKRTASTGWLGVSWRGATIFALGTFCGVLITLAAFQPSAAGGAGDAPKELVSAPLDRVAADDEPLTIDDYGGFKTVRGDAVRQAYPHLENPVVVVQPDASGLSHKRVVQGTMNNGAVQVVLNIENDSSIPRDPRFSAERGARLLYASN